MVSLCIIEHMNNSLLKEIESSKHFIARKSFKIEEIENMIHKHHLAIFCGLFSFSEESQRERLEVSLVSPLHSPKARKMDLHQSHKLVSASHCPSFFPSFPMYTVGIFGIYSVHVALSSRWSKHRFVGTPYFLLLLKS